MIIQNLYKIAQNKSKMRRNQVAVPNRTPLECLQFSIPNPKSNGWPGILQGTSPQFQACWSSCPQESRTTKPGGSGCLVKDCRCAGFLIIYQRSSSHFFLLGVYCLYLFFEWNHLTVPWANQVFWRSFVHRFIGNQPSHQLNAHNITMSTTQIVHY